MIATGGTIASTGNYYGDRGGAVNKISAEALTKAAPGIDKVATISVEQFSNVASGAIGPKQWMDLARAHHRAPFASVPTLSGVVVTHGTDTMEETAYFLDLDRRRRPASDRHWRNASRRRDRRRRPRKPLQRGARRGRSRFPRTRRMVLMDDRLFAAREVTKTNTTRVETFQAPEHGPLAIADHDTIYFSRARPTRPPRVRPRTHRAAARRHHLQLWRRGQRADRRGGRRRRKGHRRRRRGRGRDDAGQGPALRRATRQWRGRRDGQSHRIGSRRGKATRLARRSQRAEGTHPLMLALTHVRTIKELAKIFADASGIEP